VSDDGQHGDADEQRQHGESVFDHGSSLLFEFVVHTRDLIARAGANLHNVKFGMADHSAAKDAAAQATHADDASVVAEWFVHVVSFRFVLMRPSYQRRPTLQHICLHPYEFVMLAWPWLFRRWIVMGAWQTTYDLGLNARALSRGYETSRLSRLLFVVS
jgi:hypothetical protein